MESVGNEKSAAKMVQDAEKLLAGSGLIKSWWNATTNKKSACSLYLEAGRLYKNAKMWKEAAASICEAAKINYETNEKLQAAANFMDAAACHQSMYLAPEAVKCLEYAIDIYKEEDKYSTAAKLHTTVAKIYKRQLRDIRMCIRHYKWAEENYELDHNYISRNGARLTLASYYPLCDKQFDKAAAIYEDAASSAMSNSLLKHAASEYFLRAVLCYMSVDTFNGESALKRFEVSCPSFANSRECKFLKLILKDIREGDDARFTATVQTYKGASLLEDWHLGLLHQIKAKL